MIYRDVLKYGFYENLKLIELYSGLKGNNSKIVLYLYKTILQLVYPIIPLLASY
jgi:leucyl-tRNA synthetase